MLILIALNIDSRPSLNVVPKVLPFLVSFFVSTCQGEGNSFSMPTKGPRGQYCLKNIGR